MDNNELIHQSFDYDHFFGDNTDEYHTMTCVESTNENLLDLNNNGDTSIKNRTTGSIK
jgi:hypothetical protein